MEKQYRYYRISYSKKNDSYSTWIYVGNKKYPTWDDFGLEIECKCYPAYIKELGRPEDEANCISYQILTHIRQALNLDYEVKFCDRPE